MIRVSTVGTLVTLSIPHWSAANVALALRIAGTATESLAKVGLPWKVPQVYPGKNMLCTQIVLLVPPITDDKERMKRVDSYATALRLAAEKEVQVFSRHKVGMSTHRVVELRS